MPSFDCFVEPQSAANVRVGKYIGRADVVGAKRAAKAGIIISILVITIFGALFIFGRNVLPEIYTSNEQTIELTSSLMVVLWLYSSGCIVINVFGGVYRGRYSLSANDSSGS